MDNLRGSVVKSGLVLLTFGRAPAAAIVFNFQDPTKSRTSSKEGTSNDHEKEISPPPHSRYFNLW